jgi:hypothetical protein
MLFSLGSPKQYHAQIRCFSSWREPNEPEDGGFQALFGDCRLQQSKDCAFERKCGIRFFQQVCSSD